MSKVPLYCFRALVITPRDYELDYWSAASSPITVANNQRQVRCRANKAHVRQSRPDYGLDVQIQVRKACHVKVLKMFRRQPAPAGALLSSLDSHSTRLLTRLLDHSRLNHSLVANNQRQVVFLYCIRASCVVRTRHM